jgi:cytochrome c oxidase subunit 2
MKILDKLLVLAASLVLAPAVSLAQPAAPAARSAPAAAAQAKPAPPSDAISARSQAAPATPEQVSQPNMATGSEPSNAQAAQSSLAIRDTPTPGIGQPDGRAHLQEQFTPIGVEAAWFHDWILTPLILAISIFVLGLLLFVIVFFRRGVHPVPSRNTHNTVLEIVWTLVPVLILVGIAVPSIRLLAHQYSPPKADLTIKVTGNQWYWTYSYPDNGGFELTSNMLKEQGHTEKGERPRTDADGPRLLAVDERMVVPAGAVVKLIVTASDVIHSFGVPAFWVKMDAVPGRLNETWFKVDRPGVYYGQCYELCGAKHGFMPIAVEVVSPAQYAAWVASKGGTMPGAGKPALPDSTAASPVGNPPAGATTAPGGGTSATPTPTNVSAGTAAPAGTNQSQATSRGN